jgi:Fuc2NAc and GlcNAc transferase
MSDFFVAIPLFIFSVIITAWVRQFALATRLLAHPSERGLHTCPTPVGGGVAIVCTYLLGLLFIGAQGHINWQELLLLGFGLPVAIVGLIDDRFELDPRIRLLVQLFTVVGFFVFLGPIPPLQFGEYSVSGPIFHYLLLSGFLLWLTNLYNFMDGIDGLAASEACFVTFAAALLLANAGNYPLALVAICLFASCAGFLVWNWQPARIFMGDVGSVFLGLTFGLLAVLSHQHGSLSLWSWFLLLAVFIVDASITLLLRILSGRRWYLAHREHAYQHASVRVSSHKQIAIAVLIINTVWLLPLAWLADEYPEYGVYFAMLGIVPLILIAVLNGAGKVSRQ